MTTTPRYVVVDVYRDGFLLRRETLAAEAAEHVIGSSSAARIWLDSARVEAEHAVLHIDSDGRAVLEDRSRAGTYLGRRRIVREELFRGAPITITPYLLRFVKRPLDPDPSEALRNYPPLPPPPRQPRFDPEPGPADRSCPRCGVALVAKTLPSSGAAYRSAPVEALACPHCALLLVAAADLASRMSLPGRLADTPAVRKRASARGLCPACRGDLAALHLSWGDVWVVVEECGSCGLVAFDPHELEAVATIVRGLGA